MSDSRPEVLMNASRINGDVVRLVGLSNDKARFEVWTDGAWVAAPEGAFNADELANVPGLSKEARDALGIPPD